MNKSAALVLVFFVLGVALLIAILRIYEKSAQNMFAQNVALSPTLSASSSAMSKQEFKSITISLGTINNSGQSGVAVLKDVKGKTEVDLTVSPVSAIEQPAHIHIGLCPNPGAIKYPLSNIVKGKSVTVLNVSLADIIKDAPLAINVHKSAKEISKYTTCGNIVITNPQ